MPSLPNPLGLLRAPLTAIAALEHIATSADAMARDTSRLGDLHDRLAAIEGYLHSVDAEVALMRQRVDVMGEDVVALQRLEHQLADVSTAIAPLRRLGGRATRRRGESAPDGGAPQPADAA